MSVSKNEGHFQTDENDGNISLRARVHVGKSE